MSILHNVKLGTGQNVLFVHGDGPSWGEETFAEQRILADEFGLVFIDRHGFGKNPSTEHGNYLADAKDIANMLDDRSHLVGHSGGGLVCLLAANYRPDAIRSLTVIEPPDFTIMRGDPKVENLIKRFTYAYEIADLADPYRFWSEFIGAFGYDKPIERNLTEQELKGIRATMTMDTPCFDLEIPLDRLAAADFPKLIISGAWNNEPEFVRKTSGEVFNSICDALQMSIGAQRFVFNDAAHSPQIQTPKPFNDQLRAFLMSAHCVGL